MIKNFVKELEEAASPEEAAEREAKIKAIQVGDDHEAELVKRILASIKLENFYEGKGGGCISTLTNFTFKLSDHTTMGFGSENIEKVEGTVYLYGLNRIFKEQNKPADRRKRKGRLLFSQYLIEKTKEFAKEIIKKLEPGHMKELLSDLDKNIIDECEMAPPEPKKKRTDWRSPPPPPQMNTPQFTKEAEYRDLLNLLKGKSDDGCPAAKFVNDKNNISSYEQLCSKRWDSEEKKKQAKKYRRKALFRLHPDKNTNCNEESNGITQILNDIVCTGESL